MHVIRIFLPVSLACFAAFGQGAPARLEFEVASVKSSAAPSMMSPQVSVGVRINGAQVHISSLSLRDYIRYAYRVKVYQVSGPEWLAASRFEIDAKLPAGGTREQVPDMMQSLLEDRFGLKLHRGTKDFPVYGLVVAGGGLKMKELPADPEGDAEAAKAPVEVAATGGPQGVSMNFGRGSSLNFGNNKFEARKLTMAALADSLGRYLDRPVIDMTGLTGKYDFTLELTPEDYRALLIRSAIGAGVTLPPEALRLLDGASDESLHSALRGLGLKLDARKAPMDVVVIDQVNKVPTEN
jgi:uncharacterized protein (TIGR03435 family)